MAEKDNRIGASFDLDIANLQKGLKEAKQSISLTTSEFQKSTSGMNNWQKKVTGLGAKINQLTDNLKTQDTVVNNVREQYELTSKQYGENSDEAKKLLIQLNKEEATYKKLERELKIYSSRLDKLRYGLDDSKKSTINLDDAMSSLSTTITGGAKKAIGGLVTTVAGYVTSLAAVAESTREYRTDLSKLESNAESAGVSLEVTEEALKGLNAITGETDSNIEALSNLMMAGFKDNNLQDAVDTLSDAVIKFPDTLKVESLADSLQESIKQMELGNNATGQYAELLERLGYNLEEVTEQTNKKKTLEEKQAYLLELVNKKIGGTTKAYREQNGELINAADAQFELNDAMAELGEKAEPSISLVKKEVAGLIKELVNWIDTNVELEEVTDNVVDGIKSLAKTYLPPLITGTKTTFSITKTLLPIILSVGGAILTYNTYMKAATIATKAHAVASTTLKTGQLLLEVATKKQTVAQLAQNTAMKANPIGLVVGLVSALAIGIGTLVKKYNDEKKAAVDVSKATKDQSERIKEENDAIKELIKTKNENVNSGMAEIEYMENLHNELGTLIDDNGKVKKGYEDRANFILTELNEALGTELSLNDLVKGKYDEISESIDNLITKKKAKILLDAQEDLYTQAIKDQTAAMQEKIKIEGEIADLESAYQANLSKWAATGNERYKTEMDRLTNEINAKKGSYDELESRTGTYVETIAGYEDLAAAIASGNTDKIEQALKERSLSYEKNGETIKISNDEAILSELAYLAEYQRLLDEEVAKGKKAEDSKYNTQVEASKKRLAQLGQELLEQTSTIEKTSPEVTNAWKSMATNSKDTFDKIMKELPPARKEEIMKMAGIIEKDGKYVEHEYEDLAEKSVEKMDKKPEFEWVAAENVKGAKTGIENESSSAVGKVTTLAEDLVDEIDDDGEWDKAGQNLILGLGKGIGNPIIQGSILGKAWSFGKSLLTKIKNSLEEESPSKATREMGQFLLKGLGLGMEDEENSIFNQVSSFGKSVLNAFNEELSDGLTSAKSSLQTSLNVQGASANASNSGSKSQVINFYQTNNSPKSLSRLEIYRQTNNALNRVRGGLANV